MPYDTPAIITIVASDVSFGLRSIEHIPFDQLWCLLTQDQPALRCGESNIIQLIFLSKQLLTAAVPKTTSWPLKTLLVTIKSAAACSCFLLWTMRIKPNTWPASSFQQHRYSLCVCVCLCVCLCVYVFVCTPVPDLSFDRGPNETGHLPKSRSSKWSSVLLSNDNNRELDLLLITLSIVWLNNYFKIC